MENICLPKDYKQKCYNKDAIVSFPRLKRKPEISCKIEGCRQELDSSTLLLHMFQALQYAIHHEMLFKKWQPKPNFHWNRQANVPSLYTTKFRHFLARPGTRESLPLIPERDTLAQWGYSYLQRLKRWCKSKQPRACPGSWEGVSARSSHWIHKCSGPALSVTGNATVCPLPNTEHFSLCHPPDGCLSWAWLPVVAQGGQHTLVHWSISPRNGMKELYGVGLVQGYS